MKTVGEFFRYLRGRLYTVLAFLLFAVILLVTFRLYRLPLAAAVYPLCLCAVLGLTFLLLGFAREKRVREDLMLLSRLTGETVEALPDADPYLDEGYRALFTMLRTECAEMKAQNEASSRDMVDYYTLWVHQIKTPIAAMRLTLQNEDSPMQRKLSADLFRIEQYVTMVMAYLRLDSDDSDYLFRDCDLDAVIRKTVRQYSTEFIDRRLTFSYDPPDFTAVTDEKWLSFVLGQLLSNALKYTREGGIRICAEEPRTLCISDTGIGIAPEDLPRIFEKGYTGRIGREDGSASGIGLYLCRRICTKLNVGIGASSEVGKGTTVRLTLPERAVRPE